MWTASSSGRALRTGLSISARWRRPSLRRTGAIEARLWSTRTRRLTLSSVCVGAESQWSNSLLKRLRRQVCAHSVLVVARRTARLAKRPRSTRRTGPGEAPQESTGFYRIDHAHGEHDDRVITSLTLVARRLVLHPMGGTATLHVAEGRGRATRPAAPPSTIGEAAAQEIAKARRLPSDGASWMFRR